MQLDKAQVEDTVLAPLSAHKDFLDSQVWEDYRGYFEGRIRECANLLRTATEHAQILRLQGRMDELEFFLDFPERWVADMEFEATKQPKEDGNA